MPSSDLFMVAGVFNGDERLKKVLREPQIGDGMSGIDEWRCGNLGFLNCRLMRR